MHFQQEPEWRWGKETGCLPLHLTVSSEFQQEREGNAEVHSVTRRSMMKGLFNRCGRDERKATGMVEHLQDSDQAEPPPQAAGRERERLQGPREG